MRVEHHLRFVEQLVRWRAAGAGGHAERDVAPRELERRLRIDRKVFLGAGYPALGIDRLHGKAPCEMAVECFSQCVRLIARDVQRGCGHEDQAVAHQPQVHRIRAHPAQLARVAARAEQRERARGERLFELESLMQPGLEALRAGAGAAAAREQQLERRQPRRCRRGEQAWRYELAVHFCSGTTRAAPVATHFSK